MIHRKLAIALAAANAIAVMASNVSAQAAVDTAEVLTVVLHDLSDVNGPIVQVTAPLECTTRGLIPADLEDCLGVGRTWRPLISYVAERNAVLVSTEAPLPACIGTSSGVDRGREGLRLEVFPPEASPRGVIVRTLVQCESERGPFLHAVIRYLERETGEWSIVERVNVVS